MQVSHESIYRTLYVQSRGALPKELTRYLRTGQVIRRPKGVRLPDGRGGRPNSRRIETAADNEARLNALNTALVAGLAQSGKGLVSSTQLSGKYAIRLCILNHSTSQHDVDEVLAWFETAAETTTEPRARHYERTSDVTAGWPSAPGATLEILRSIPLLTGVEARWLTWVATVGRRRSLAAGEIVIRQWDVDRDFYLLLEGEAEVSGGERLLSRMHAGDFFGELAALDWGASFGHPRLATVKATTDLDLLVLTDTELAELMAAVP